MPKNVLSPYLILLGLFLGASVEIYLSKDHLDDSQDPFQIVIQNFMVDGSRFSPVAFCDRPQGLSSSCLHKYFYGTIFYSITKVHGVSPLAEPDTKVLRIWYFSLGRVLSEVGMDPLEFVSQWEIGPLREFLIDGWSFNNLLKYQYSKSLALCRDHMSTELLESCLFGLGRAGYFRPELWIGARAIDPIFISGYLFSKLSTGKLDTVPAGVSACLEIRHPLHCGQNHFL